MFNFFYPIISRFLFLPELKRLTPNPAYAALEDRAMDGPEPARFMCPVTLQEMNGLHQFVVLFSTGWVMAEKATKEVGIVGLQVNRSYGTINIDFGR